jgi:dethiobiotin synthetase
MAVSENQKAGVTAGFFVTGTDTDVGKTFISAKICQSLIAQGYSVRVRKPIASGCIRQADDTLLSEDALQLQQGAQTSESLAEICPYQFEPPVSPHLALQQANLHVSIQQLAEHCQISQQDNEMLIVEGAGGWLSPLASDGFNQDLAVILQLPVILVIANRLGCLNSALLSAQAIRQAGLRLHSVVINNVGNGQDYSQGMQQWIGCPLYYQNYCRQPELSPLEHFKI